MHPSIHAQRNPDKPAYIMADSGQVVTYGQLDRRSNRAAQLFRSLGLRAGDHIAILMENNPHLFEVVWAAQRSGLIYTAISTHLLGEDITYILDNSDARLLVTTELQTEVASQALTHAPRVEHALMVGATSEGFKSYEALTAAQSSEPIADECGGADMLYSSGTTGRPKGVSVALSGSSIEAMPAVMAGLGKLYTIDGETVYLSPAPLYHAAPLRFSMLTMFCGGTVVVMEKFDAQRALELIGHYQVTHSQWVPIMFIRLLKLANRNDFDLSSQRVVIHAAAPCPPEIKQQMINWWGPIIHEYYSSTEGIGFTGLDSEEWLAHPGSVGRALVGQLQIIDDEETKLAAGEVGNVYFSDGPDFIYHKDQAKTAEARNKLGWYSVGDVGYLDDDGFLFLTDRKAFMIISGGVNIYPQEAENLLAAHPKVADVAVVGIPNAEYGEEVKAVVQAISPEHSGEALAAELLDYCKQHLASIKCPRSVDFDSELPRYPNGKLYKKRVRDRYWS